jgi:beta-lactam-binding protein with PASTA domain
MRLGTRVWGIGKFLVLAGALGLTFLVFFGLAMRMTLRAREVEVPSLAGRTVADATRIAAAVGLGLRVDDNPRSDEKVPAGQIMQQDPPAGVRTRQQRSVRVWVSAGARATIVPSLIGQSDRTARIRLEQDGIAPGVSLLVNRGEEATRYVMPDVIGTEGDRAAAALRARGFRVTITGSQPYPGIPAGTVVRQTPAGGFRVGTTDPISLEVSR